MMMTRICLTAEEEQKRCPAAVMHGRIASAFPVREPVLWRQDEETVLIVSEKPPDRRQLQQAFGSSDVRMIDYDRWLDHLQEGKVGFRMDVNPRFRKYRLGCTNRSGLVQAEKKRHPNNPRVCCRTSHQVLVWLRRVGAEKGFRIQEDSVRFWRRFETVACHGTDQFSVISYVLEGMLEITDVQRFREVLKRGIGSAKAYGHGLVTVIPAEVSYGV